MQGYGVYEETERAAQRDAAMRAEEAEQKVHAYRRRQAGVNTSLTLSPDVDRVMQLSPGVGWYLSRAPATPPLYLDSARLPDARRLPQLEKLLNNLQRATCDQHWDKAQGVGHNIKRIMGRLGEVLEPSACNMEGAEDGEMDIVFAQPLQYERRGLFGSGVEGACMLLSEAKVATAKGMYQQERCGYVKVTLGELRGRSITEWGHRLVLWAMHGPPVSPAGWTTRGPHCLHMCGHKDCLNPSHLVWGTARDNRVDDDDVYFERLQEQGRRSGRVSAAAASRIPVPVQRAMHGHMGGGSVGGGSGGGKRQRRRSLAG